MFNTLIDFACGLPRLPWETNFGTWFRLQRKTFRTICWMGQFPLEEWSTTMRRMNARSERALQIRKMNQWFHEMYWKQSRFFCRNCQLTEFWACSYMPLGASPTQVPQLHFQTIPASRLPIETVGRQVKCFCAHAFSRAISTSKSNQARMPEWHFLLPPSPYYYREVTRTGERKKSNRSGSPTVLLVIPNVRNPKSKRVRARCKTRCFAQLLMTRIGHLVKCTSNESSIKNWSSLQMVRFFIQTAVSVCNADSWLRQLAQTHPD